MSTLTTTRRISTTRGFRRFTVYSDYSRQNRRLQSTNYSRKYAQGFKGGISHLTTLGGGKIAIRRGRR